MFDPPTPDMSSYVPIPARSDKIIIVTIDSPQVMLTAQYNPKEMSISKSVPWNKHKTPKGDTPMLEFTSAENRIMSLELFFDAMESGGSVVGQTDMLTTMTKINPMAMKDSERHPPRVMIIFGMGKWFRGVIESLDIKYTMFLNGGMPARATCSLKIKEVDAVQVGGQE